MVENRRHAMRPTPKSSRQIPPFPATRPGPLGFLPAVITGMNRPENSARNQQSRLIICLPTPMPDTRRCYDRPKIPRHAFPTPKSGLAGSGGNI